MSGRAPHSPLASRDRLLRSGCYVVSAALLGGSGLYLALGADTGLGIFLVLISAVSSRVLILDIAEQRPAR